MNHSQLEDDTYCLLPPSIRTTSAFMQVMLKSILDTFFNADAMVRLAAVQVIGLILRQGLIHPAQVNVLATCPLTKYTYTYVHI